MKQLGNLAVICAQRPELLMQLRGGLVLVQAKNRAAMEAAWNDDARIEKIHLYGCRYWTCSCHAGVLPNICTVIRDRLGHW